MMTRNLHSQGDDGRSRNQRTEALAHRTALYCSMLCVKTAIEMINVMNDHLTSDAAWGQKPAWLYAVLRKCSSICDWPTAACTMLTTANQDIYLAATVLLAARLAPIVLLGEVSQDEIQEAWNRALDILDRFQADNVSAKRCVAALKLLYQRLPGGAAAQDGAEPLGTTQSDGDATIADSPTAPFPPHSADSGTPNIGFYQDLDPDWMPDLHLSDPYDMAWFQVTASGLYSV